MAALRFAPRARADIQAILAYISADSPERARAFVDHIRARCEMLCSTPEMGRLRPEFGALRSLQIKPVIIFYRFDGNTVEVARVIDGRRDFGTIFADDV